MPDDKKQTAAEFAAERRSDYARALKEERDGLERLGKTDRVKQVDAELKRLAAEAKPAAQASRQG